jgi:asparagine synthetase B (glutamine-hydrolysing)
MMEQQYGVTIDRVPIGPAGMLKDADQAVRAVESPLLDEQWVNNHIVYERMHQLGARTVLTGHWGDQVLFLPSYLVDLFNRFAFHDVQAHLKEFNAWIADLPPATFTRQFCFDLIKHYTPRALLPIFWQMRLGTRDYPWYTDTLRKRARRQLWNNPPPRRSFASAHARAVYEEARIGYHVLCMEWNNKVAAMHGMEIAFPMLDRDLLAFLMAIPGDMQTYRGVPRALLRESMRGILPEAIAQRRWKADFTQLVNEGVRKDFPQILDRLSQTGYAATRGYVNARTLWHHLDTTRADLARPVDGRPASALTNLLALELWLETFFEGVPTR